jgi:hypothetical protein
MAKDAVVDGYQPHVLDQDPFGLLVELVALGPMDPAWHSRSVNSLLCQVWRPGISDRSAPSASQPPHGGIQSYTLKRCTDRNLAVQDL